MGAGHPFQLNDRGNTGLSVRQFLQKCLPPTVLINLVYYRSKVGLLLLDISINNQFII